jgi:hypothetical protein
MKKKTANAIFLNKNVILQKLNKTLWVLRQQTD